MTRDASEGLAIAGDAIEVIRADVEAGLVDDLEGLGVKNHPRELDDLAGLVGHHRPGRKVASGFKVDDDQVTWRVGGSFVGHQLGHLVCEIGGWD